MSELMWIILQAPGCLTLHLVTIVHCHLVHIWKVGNTQFYTITFICTTYHSIHLYVHHTLTHWCHILGTLCYYHEVYIFKLEKYLNIQMMKILAWQLNQPDTLPSLGLSKRNIISENIRTDLKHISHNSSNGTKTAKTKLLLFLLAQFSTETVRFLNSDKIAFWMFQIE